MTKRRAVRFIFRQAINGDIHSNGGEIIFNTVLGDDNSATDKLVVNGNTSGTTWVSVLNAGGSGAKTLNGIELVRVNGSSDGVFISYMELPFPLILRSQ